MPRKELAVEACKDEATSYQSEINPITLFELANAALKFNLFTI